MSSSRAPKVIVGSTGTSLDETSLDSLHRGRVRAWDPNLEAEYWKRIRAKAEAMALDIVNKAKVEAEELRRQAMQEGYAEGARLAQQELDTSVAAWSQSLGSALSAIDAQTKTVWQAWRQDVALLVRAAVEKTIRLEVSSRRSEVLSSLLDQAVELLDSGTNLTVKVNPQDEELIGELLEHAKQDHPGLARWRVKASPDIAPGGLVIESGQGMVDNTLASRFADVAPILDQLDLEGEG